MQQARSYHGVLDNALCHRHVLSNHFGLPCSVKGWLVSLIIQLAIYLVGLESCLVNFASALPQAACRPNAFYNSQTMILAMIVKAQGLSRLYFSLESLQVLLLVMCSFFFNFFILILSVMTDSSTWPLLYMQGQVDVCKNDTYLLVRVL